jgi:hypothetical protein
LDATRSRPIKRNRELQLLAASGQLFDPMVSVNVSPPARLRAFVD